MTEDNIEDLNPEPIEGFGELTPENYANSEETPPGENLFILDGKGRQKFNDMRRKLADDLPDFNNLPNI